MSNGIGKNPLTDISKVYLQQIANESAVPGKPAEKLKTDRNMFNIPKDEQQAAKERVLAKTKKKQMEKGISSAGYTKEGLDPVNPVAVKKKFANRKDRDLDNDGDTDSSDKYLHKRRKAIAGAMKKRMSEGVRDMDPEKGTAERKARLEKKRGMKLDDHPQYKKEEVEQVDENRAAMGRINKEYHRKKEAEAMAAKAKAPKDKKPAPKRLNDNPMYDPKSAGSSQVKDFKFTKEEASMSPGEVALQKKKAMIDKMIAAKRMQGLKSAKKSEAPTKAMGEGKELSIDDQMRISREANAKRKPYQPGDRQKQRAAQIKQMAKNAPKDTRTDAQKMTDATGPRPGSRYRGD